MSVKDRAELRFRLPGTWVSLIGDPEAEAVARREFVRSVLGVSDELGAARHLLRDSLASAGNAAAERGALALFVASEVKPGVPLAVSLSVFDPQLRMSPTIGVDPADVRAMLRESLTALEVEGVADVVELEVQNSAILRLHRIEIEKPDEEAQVSIRRLVADYWYTVPGTKNVLLVNFITPMGDIPNVMLQFFDAIVKASYFEMPEAAESEEAESVET